MEDEQAILKYLLSDVGGFAEIVCGRRLRSYQLTVANAVVASVAGRQGRSLVVLWPRQSGKNELQAHIEAYLLFLLQRSAGEIVKVSPTWKPQSQNAMDRLESVLKRSALLSGLWSKESGYIYRIGAARITFLSGDPSANVVGATASTLLECDEAQDVLISKWDKEFLPMAASTNATRLYWGTAWTSQTLLGRELRLARQAEQADGVQRLFTLTADQVRLEAPAYGRFIDEQVRKLGRTNPLVRTQLFSEEIDGESGMFPSTRRMLMQGSHPPYFLSSQGESRAGGQGEGVSAGLAFQLDVGGQDESAAGGLVENLANPRRDSTALTVVRIDLAAQPAASASPQAGLPMYRVVYRRLWTGLGQSELLAQVLALADKLRPDWIVVDSTGIGAGLASHLQRLVNGPRLLPYHFTQASKSDLAWKFLAIVDTGRYREYALPPGSSTGAALGRSMPTELDDPRLLQALFWKQVEACEMEVLPGPQRNARWGVPPNRRDSESGLLLHDDLLISAALCAALESAPHRPAASALVAPPDPLGRLEEVF